MYSRVTFELITQTLPGALASIKQQHHTSVVSEWSLAACKLSWTMQCVVDEGSLVGESGASGQRKGAASVGVDLLSPQWKAISLPGVTITTGYRPKKRGCRGVSPKFLRDAGGRGAAAVWSVSNTIQSWKGGKHGKNSSTDDHITGCLFPLVTARKRPCCTANESLGAFWTVPGHKQSHCKTKPKQYTATAIWH